MPYIVIGAFFLALAYYAPDAFVAFGEFVDGARCSIGMDSYCDTNYDWVREFSKKP